MVGQRGLEPRRPLAVEAPKRPSPILGGDRAIARMALASLSTLASASFCVSGLTPPRAARALTEDSGIPLPSVYWLFSPPELVVRGHYHRSLAGVEILPAHVGAQHEIHNVCVVVQVAHWGLGAQLLTREIAVAPVDRGPAPVLVQAARNN